MRASFDARLEGLEARLLQMGQLVRRQLDRALDALATADPALADEVTAGDDAVDRAYVEIEREILRTLALEAPVAGDLRLVAAILHVNAHLERMGDLCVNMARFVSTTAQYPPVPAIRATLAEMGGHARDLLAAAMTAFARRDVGLAASLPGLDEPIDRLNQRILHQIERAADDDRALEWAARMVLVARYLERLGDHAVDIGEQVAFVVRGEPPQVASAGG